MVTQTMSAIEGTRNRSDAMNVIFPFAAGKCRHSSLARLTRRGDGRGCYWPRRRFSWSWSRSVRRLRFR